MDPTACFRRMAKAFELNDWNEVGEAAEDLKQWLRNGGSAPDQLQTCGAFAVPAALAICEQMTRLGE